MSAAIVVNLIIYIKNFAASTEDSGKLIIFSIVIADQIQWGMR